MTSEKYAAILKAFIDSLDYRVLEPLIAVYCTSPILGDGSAWGRCSGCTYCDDTGFNCQMRDFKGAVMWYDRLCSGEWVSVDRHTKIPTLADLHAEAISLYTRLSSGDTPGPR